MTNESFTIPTSMSLSSEAQMPQGGRVKSRKEVGRRVLGGLGSHMNQSPAQTSGLSRNISGGNLATPTFRTKDVESIYSAAGPEVFTQHIPNVERYAGDRYITERFGNASNTSPRESVSECKQTTMQYQSNMSHYQTSVSADRYTEKGERILKEYYKEYEYPTEQKVLVEEEYERIVVVPEKRVVEKVVQNKQKVRKRIIEVEVPIIVEKEVEVPEIEYREVPVPVPERKIQENIIRVPKVEVRERIVEVPKIIYEEREVEVACPEYYEVEYETIVEVPEIQTETQIIPKPVPQYIDVDVPEVVPVYVEEDTPVKVPVPLEYTTKLELQFPTIQSVYNRSEVPVYMPRFIEVAVPADKLTDVEHQTAREINARLSTQLNGRETMMAEAMVTLANDVQRLSVNSKNTGTTTWPALWERGQIKLMSEIQNSAKDIETMISARNAAN